MTVGGRIYLKKDNSGLELVKAFAKIPTANIADTMGRSCAMHPRIKLFSSPHGTVWAGIALTSNLVGEITFLYTQLWIWLEKVM